MTSVSVPSVVYQFPKAAEYGRVIPKNKIYKYGSSSKAIKQLFNEVDQIRWSYKLAPNTVNLPATNAVQEIQVISITLRGNSLSDEVLQVIDMSIPSPILFELNTGNKLQYAACFKRRNEADKSRWVISGYFRSEWMSLDTKRQPIPVSLSLETLYHSFICLLVSLVPRKGESIQSLVDRANLIKMKLKEAEKLVKKRNAEKQFKYRVELNQALHELQKEIEALG